MPHLLAIIVLIVLPIIGYFETRRLKSDISDRTKESAYLRMYIWYGSALAIILFNIDFFSIYMPDTAFTLPHLLNLILWSIVVYHVFMLIVPTVLIIFKKSMRNAVAAEYKNKEHMFPQSKKSMVMFAILAFVVGISEEIFFRGYLYAYFQEEWGFTALLSFVVINVIFGLLHFHQGRSAIIDTMLLGFAMSHLYIKSGSLLLPIIFHILYDLKIVMFTWIIKRHKAD